MKSSHRNLLPTSPMFDSVELVRDSKIVKTIPRLEVEAAPKPEKQPRHPQIISGHIRQIAELIATRDERIGSKDDIIACDIMDALRITELLDELDSALIVGQYESSLRGRK